MPAAENSHSQRVLSSLNQQRALGRFCDAVLNVGGGTAFLVHRNILACFSELFQQSSMPAATCMEFSLQECTNDGMELLLNFVYTGELNLDADNLEKVQYAAASLCVPEALALCRQFKETSEDPTALKRKRGRPRKSTSHAKPLCPVKEENLTTKDESSFDSATTSSSMGIAGTTTTRSGRVVKGPRRLVTDENPPSEFMPSEKPSKRPLLSPTESKSGNVVSESQNQDQPTGETVTQNVRSYKCIQVISFVLLLLNSSANNET